MDTYFSTPFLIHEEGDPIGKESTHHQQRQRAAAKVLQTRYSKAKTADAYSTKYLLNSYAPPTAWTYPISGDPSNGQSMDAVVAGAKIKLDIDESVSRALASMNIDVSELPTYEIKPLKAKVLKEAPTSQLVDPKWYLARAGTVLFECIQAADSKSNCETMQLSDTITVSTRYPLSERQKMQLGSLLASQLTNRKLFLPNQVIPL
uniref:PsbP domain-containing protein n=1 Tax=Ascaris lumbricoides TaxID=6252 RepID=A0A0M3HPZ3_ASCLU